MDLVAIKVTHDMNAPNRNLESVINRIPGQSFGKLLVKVWLKTNFNLIYYYIMGKNVATRRPSKRPWIILNMTLQPHASLSGWSSLNAGNNKC